MCALLGEMPQAKLSSEDAEVVGPWPPTWVRPAGSGLLTGLVAQSMSLTAHLSPMSEGCIGVGCLEIQRLEDRKCV